MTKHIYLKEDNGVTCRMKKALQWNHTNMKLAKAFLKKEQDMKNR